MKSVNDSVLSRRGWDGEVGVAEFDCVRDDLAFGVRIDKLEAAVGDHGWTNVEAIFSKKVPGSVGYWLGMDEDPTSYRTKWPSGRWYQVVLGGRRELCREVCHLQMPVVGAGVGCGLDGIPLSTPSRCGRWPGGPPNP